MSCSSPAERELTQPALRQAELLPDLNREGCDAARVALGGRILFTQADEQRSNSASKERILVRDERVRAQVSDQRPRCGAVPEVERSRNANHCDAASLELMCGPEPALHHLVVQQPVLRADQPNDATGDQQIGGSL